MIKNAKLLFFIILVIFVAILFSHKSNAAGPEKPVIHLNIRNIKETQDGFLINGSVIANGPHDREGIYDVYYIEVDAIIKNSTSARYPNFKEWAYEPESIAYYYPKAETRYVPGSGPGNTMTKEEAYGVNVSIIPLFTSDQLGKFDFETVVPLEYKGKEFRIQATLNWDFTGVNAYWWAHRYVNDIGCEGVFGEGSQFLYSDGVKITYPDGSIDEKFSWKANWPTDEKLKFEFTKNNSYLALWGGSLIGDSSVSGEITKDRITIRKNASDTPLEFTSTWGQYMIAGEGEVSIVPEIHDENGTLILKGWGNLTDEIPPEEWEEWKDFVQSWTKKIGTYIWTHKIEIAGGIFIKVTTGIPGFVFTMPAKYIAQILGWISVPPSVGDIQHFKEVMEAYNSSMHNHGYIKYGYGGCLHYCKLYVITNDTGMSIYLTEGKATLEGKNGSINISAGKFATLLNNGSLTTPQSFDENKIEEKTGLTMKTLWNAKEIELKDFILCKKLNENDEPVKAITNFSTKDKVCVWLSLLNASDGDKIKFIFEGPNNIAEEANYTLNWSGSGYCYIWLSLANYGKNGIGQWKVTAYINEKKAGIAYFDVKAAKKVPGFELILLITAILFAFRKRN